MDNKQENRYSMFLAVQQVCNDNNSVWAPLPAYVTTFGLFEAGIADIDATRIQQEKDLKGIAEEKKVKEDEMIRQALKIAKPMVAYANVIGDTTLRQEVDYTESELRKSRDTVLENKCQIIHDRANTHIASLAPYGILPAGVTAYQTAIDDYHSVIAGPRSAIALRKTQTLQLNEKLNAANSILTGQIDQLTELFKDTNPTYYNDYFNARIIVNLGGGQFTFTGTVLNGEIKTVFSNANDDAESFEISNTGTSDLKVGRGANGTDMGNAIGLAVGVVLIKTAIELGNSGNTYLNIQNVGGADDGAYKVVRL